MADMDIHYEALEACRVAANKASGRFGALNEGIPKAAKKPTDAAAFGKVAGAAALAAALNAAWSTLSLELVDARDKLKGVEQALETVQDNVANAHQADS